MTMEHEWLFHYGIMRHTGKVDAAKDLVKSQILGVGVAEFKSLKAKWDVEDKIKRDKGNTPS